MTSRAHARARHRGRGSEKARKIDLDPVRLFTGYKYRSHMGTQIARCVVQQCAHISFLRALSRLTLLLAPSHLRTKERARGIGVRAQARACKGDKTSWVDHLIQKYIYMYIYDLQIYIYVYTCMYIYIHTYIFLNPMINPTSLAPLARTCLGAYAYPSRSLFCPQV